MQAKLRPKSQQNQAFLDRTCQLAVSPASALRKRVCAIFASSPLKESPMSLAQAHHANANVEPAIAGWFSAATLAGAAYLVFAMFALGLA
jgi:hypothetical protein